MISIPIITPIITLLVDRFFPKYSTIPQDFENMWRVARERAELDFNHEKIEMLKKSMTMMSPESYDFLKKRTNEIEMMIGERTQTYLNQQLELYKNQKYEK